MDLDAHLEALTDNLKAEHGEIIFVTARQLRGLNILLKDGLNDTSRDVRVGVLALLAGPAMKDICGVEVKSSKNLTFQIARFLINLLKDPLCPPDNWYLSDYGIELIAETEARFKELSQSA